MKLTTSFGYFLASTLACLFGSNAHAASQDRLIDFRYAFTVPAIAPGEGPVEIFVPVAANDEHQTVLKQSIKTSDPKLRSLGQFANDKVYKNRFWHLSLPNTGGKPLEITFDYTIKRRVHQTSALRQSKEVHLKPEEKSAMALFLRSNKRVPISGTLIDKVRQDIPKSGKSLAARARAIYDHVVDTMEYKKIGNGWGHGDTFWACSQKYGNCTDFHALFNSLARAEGIPARFEIGFPLPSKKTAGSIKGYHCWVNFYVPDAGWVPIDASEAKKDLAKRDLYFGTHPADRIKFSVGRDIQLGEKHLSEPLNYFVYPLIEVNGDVVANFQKSFSFSQPTMSH